MIRSTCKIYSNVMFWSFGFRTVMVTLAESGFVKSRFASMSRSVTCSSRISGKGIEYQKIQGTDLPHSSP